MFLLPPKIEYLSKINNIKSTKDVAILISIANGNPKYKSEICDRMIFNYSIASLSINSLRWGVQFFIARNCTKSNLEELKKLSNSKDCDIKSAVANNKNCPIEILEKLSDDRHWEVRYVVAKNINSPIYILQKLSNDTDTYIRDAAKAALAWRVRGHQPSAYPTPAP